MIHLQTLRIPLVFTRPNNILLARMCNSGNMVNLQSWNFVQSINNIKDLYGLLNVTQGIQYTSEVQMCRVIEPLFNEHFSLLIELYRDFMLSLGYMYPPYHKIDSRNRSCFLTHLEVAESITGEAMEELMDLKQQHPQKSFAELKELLQKRNTPNSNQRVIVMKVEIHLRQNAFAYFGFSSYDGARVACVTILKFFPVIMAQFQQQLEDWERESTTSSSALTIQGLMDHATIDTPAPTTNSDVYGINVPLKGYQWENVLWMERREQVSLDSIMWGKVTESVSYSPILNFWRRGKHETYGGILADEMGMGKTLSMLAVISRNRSTSYYKNLVVVPTSLVGQWKKEIESKTTLSVYVFHGPRRKKEPAHLSSVDIVLTTYGIVRSDHQILEAYQWDRIVLDESHTIKNLHAVVSKRCRSLNAKKRWLISGTPMVTSSNDICSQLAFLGLLTHRGMFRRLVQNNFVRLQFLLKRLMRKRKQAVISLPILREHVVHLQLPQEEKEKYDNLHASALRSGYNITALVHLREFCSNGNSKCSESNNVRYVVDPEFEPETCAICLDIIDQAVRTNCRHHFCEECISHYIQVRNGTAPCPLCRASVKLLTLHRVVCEMPTNEQAVQSTAPFVKIAKILEDVKKMALARKKIIVFSQYKNTMRFMKQVLDTQNVRYAYLSGNMAQKKRSKMIDKFQTDEEVNIFLLSVRSGAVGIDLTAASDIVFAEPCLHNIKRQAIARAHRLGQQNQVTVHHYLLEDTVEEKMHEMGATFVSSNQYVVNQLLSR
jgi:SNF2 family DNA or RNA helicase